MKDRWLRFLFPPILAYVLYELYTIASQFEEPDKFSLPFFLAEVLSAYVYYEASRFFIRYFRERMKSTPSAIRLLVQFSVTLLVSTLFAVPLYALVKQLHIVYQPQNDVLNIYHLTSQFMSTLVMVLIIFSVNLGVDYFTQLNQREVAFEQLEKEKVRSQFDLLKSQVDPHFLFNSLNTLHNLIRTQSEFTEEFVLSLSKTMRYSLEEKTDEVMPINKELEALQHYIFLQKRRFGSAFDFSVSLTTEELEKVYVLPFTLQTLVENAIKHNVVSEECPLLIDLFMEDDYLVIENSRNLKEVDEGEKLGTGLENLKQRYSFFTDNRVRVTETTNNFKVRIPLLYVEKT